MSSEFAIRDLRVGDIDMLVNWLNEFNSSFDYPGKRPINDEMATEFFAGFIDNPHQSAIIAEAQGKPVAVLGFAMTLHPWNGDKIFYKMFWYSKSPGAGIKLLSYARDLCKAGNVKQMIVSGMDDKSMRILELEGFKLCETSFVLDLDRN